MFYIEFVAIVFSLSAVCLSINKSVYTWPIGIIGVIGYLYIFFDTKLYADCLLQIFFMAQGIYGWYNWRGAAEESIVVSTMSTLNRILSFIVVLLAAIFVANLLMKFTDASSPYPDAFASCLSLMANWLMAKKKIENWIYWILADLIYIALFLYKGLYLSSFLYSIFLIMCVGGLLKWNRQRKLKPDFY